MALALAVNCRWNPSNEPKNSSIAAPSSPSGLSPPSGRQVRPEHRVVDVPAEVEREALLQAVDRPERVLVPGLGQLVERGVGAGDVGRVVLAVVQLHDLARDVGLECPVVVGQVRQRVLSPCVLLRPVWFVTFRSTLYLTREAGPGHHRTRYPAASTAKPKRRLFDSVCV